MGVTSATAVEAYSRREIQLTLLFACLGTVFDGVELNLLSYPLVYISQTLNVAIVSIVAAITHKVSLHSWAALPLGGWGM